MSKSFDPSFDNESLRGFPNEKREEILAVFSEESVWDTAASFRITFSDDLYDGFQESFLSQSDFAFRSESIEQAKTHFIQGAVRIARCMRKQRRRESHVLENYARNLETTWHERENSFDPEHQAILVEDAERMNRLLDQLSEECRVVFIRHGLQEEKLRSVAFDLGIPLRRARWLYKKAQKVLRSLIGSPDTLLSN